MMHPPADQPTEQGEDLNKPAATPIGAALSLALLLATSALSYLPQRVGKAEQDDLTSNPDIQGKNSTEN